MNITIRVVPHNRQRYETVGDWYYDKKGDLQIRISRMGDWRYESLVALHELTEAILCKNAKVSQDSVDRFDMAFEKARRPGNVDEPGDDPSAPYHDQHVRATGLERVVAAALDVDWSEYAEEIVSL